MTSGILGLIIRNVYVVELMLEPNSNPCSIFNELIFAIKMDD